MQERAIVCKQALISLDKASKGLMWWGARPLPLPFPSPSFPSLLLPSSAPTPLTSQKETNFGLFKVWCFN